MTQRTIAIGDIHGCAKALATLIDIINPTAPTLAGSVDWTRGFNSLELVKQGEHDSTWSPVWGERSKVRDRYRTATVRFRRKTPPAEFLVEVRAYEEGVALRYIIEEASSTKSVRIESEQSEFRLTADHDIWAVYSAQGKYSKVKLSEIKHSIERPCALETADGTVIPEITAASFTDVVPK